MIGARGPPAHDGADLRDINCLLLDEKRAKIGDALCREMRPRACGRAACREANYCAVVVRSVVLPEGGLCCAGLALAPSFLISLFASGLPSIGLTSAVLAAPLCLPFFLLGSDSGSAASAAICSAVRVGPV